MQHLWEVEEEGAVGAEAATDVVAMFSVCAKGVFAKVSAQQEGSKGIIMQRLAYWWRRQCQLQGRKAAWQCQRSREDSKVWL